MLEVGTVKTRRLTWLVAREIDAGYSSFPSSLVKKGCVEPVGMVTSCSTGVLTFPKGMPRPLPRPSSGDQASSTLRGTFLVGGWVGGLVVWMYALRYEHGWMYLCIPRAYKKVGGMTSLSNRCRNLSPSPPDWTVSSLNHWAPPPVVHVVDYSHKLLLTLPLIRPVGFGMLFFIFLYFKYVTCLMIPSLVLKAEWCVV